MTVRGYTRGRILIRMQTCDMTRQLQTLKARWRRWRDRERIQRLSFTETRLAGTWALVRDLDEDQRSQCFRSASQAIERYRQFVERYVTTQNVMWRCASSLDEGELQRQWRETGSAAACFKGSHDPRGIVPVLTEHCFDSEMIRREMRSDEGREKATEVIRFASDKVGLLALLAK